MLHLDDERLAALADELPSATEAEHLAACAICAREADAYRGLRATSSRTGAVVLDAPLTHWDALAPALRDAGVIRTGADRAPAGGSLGTRLRPWMRYAAAVLIGVGGAAIGRATAPASALTTTASTAGVSSQAGTSQLVSNGIKMADGTQITSLTDALAVMQRAEHDYRVAAAFIAARDSSYGRGDADRYRARLASLDKVSDAAREAVNTSPDDPVLNQYLLSVRSAREITLQQLGNTLPAGVRLASY